jgi:PAS domain S-box-containing protein
MRAEQSFRQMVLDTMGEGLIVVDAEATITYVNNRLLHLTDYTREMLYGRSVGLIFHPSQRERLVKSLTNHRRDTLPFSQQLFTRHGESVPVLLSRAMASNDQSGSTVMVVTDLTELQRQEGALQLQTQRLQVINRAANAISSARSIDDVVMITLESALHVVHGMTATMLLRDLDNLDVLVSVASIGTHVNDASVERVPLGEGLSGWVAQSAKSQLVLNLADNEQFMVEYRDWHGPDLRSAIVVPLIASDEVIGVLRLVNKHEGVFDEQDLKTLESLAASAAIAIENVRLFDQMSRRVTELSTLLDASAAVSSTLDFGDILERIARRLSVALQVERVVIADWHRQTNQLDAMAEVVNAYWAPGYGPVRPLNTLPITRRVLETGKPFIAQKIDPRVTAEFNPSRLYLYVGFPITFDNQTVGVVMLYSEKLVQLPSETQTNPVADVIKRWEEPIQQHDVRDWVARSNLTDLCQQVLQASGARWCSVAYWEQAQSQVRVLREIGRALWLENPGIGWNVGHYSSLFKVLQSGEPLTLQINNLENDPQEQEYLRSVGGVTCLAAPLFIHGESKGVVRLIDSRMQDRVFDDAELSLCQGIANVVGNAMENAQLYAAQEQRASALEAA